MKIKPSLRFGAKELDIIGGINANLAKSMSNIHLAMIILAIWHTLSQTLGIDLHRFLIYNQIKYIMGELE